MGRAPNIPDLFDSGVAVIERGGFVRGEGEGPAEFLEGVEPGGVFGEGADFGAGGGDVDAPMNNGGPVFVQLEAYDRRFGLNRLRGALQLPQRQEDTHSPTDTHGTLPPRLEGGFRG